MPAVAQLSWISLVTVWILWGSTYLGIRVAVQTIPPLLMAGTRFLVAGTLLTLVVWIAQRKALRPLRASDLRSVVITGVLLLAVGTGSLCWAEVRMPSGLAALIVAGVPVWMMLFDAAFSRKLQKGAVLGIAVGLAGMALLVGMPSAGVPLIPVLVLIGGSMSWAFGSVLARRQHCNSTHPLFPALEMIAGGTALLIVSALSGEYRGLHPGAVTPASLAGFLWLVVMGSMVAYSAYGYAVRTLPTNVVATYGYVNPVVAVALGATILREPLTLNIFAGGATIITAVVIILIANARKEVTRELADAA